MRKILMSTIAVLLAVPAMATEGFVFPSIDGGEIDLAAYRGQPVLVANTASLCGFTYQYDGLQALYDAYRDQGLVVLAVPSNDFRQELGSADEVKEFCEINFNLDLPMTDITSVRGRSAHPFYAWLEETQDFVPGWNFAKVLLDAEGEYVTHFGTATKPMSPRITSRVEALLAQ